MNHQRTKKKYKKNIMITFLKQKLFNLNIIVLVVFEHIIDQINDTHTSQGMSRICQLRTQSKAVLGILQRLTHPKQRKKIYLLLL